MMWATLPALAALATTLLLVTRSAHADDRQAAAKQKFADAANAHVRGDFGTAAVLFEQAYRLAPAAGAKFNSGIAWDEAGELPRAADAYETAVETGGLTEEEAAQAVARLGTLKRALGYISIDSPLGAVAQVAHARSSVPLRVHVLPGVHVIVAEHQGKKLSARVEVQAGEVKHVSFEVAAPSASPPRSAAPRTAPVAPAEADGSHRASPSDATARTWGWVAVTAGAVLAGAAIVLGAETLDARDDWDASGHRAVDVRERAVTLRALTNVAWGGALAAGGTGAFLLLAPRARF